VGQAGRRLGSWRFVFAAVAVVAVAVAASVIERGRTGCYPWEERTLFTDSILCDGEPRGIWRVFGGGGG
jgi:hypothetical protein